MGAMGIMTCRHFKNSNGLKILFLNVIIFNFWSLDLPALCYVPLTADTIELKKQDKLVSKKKVKTVSTK